MTEVAEAPIEEAEEVIVRHTAVSEMCLDPGPDQDQDQEADIPNPSHDPRETEKIVAGVEIETRRETNTEGQIKKEKEKTIQSLNQGKSQKS